MLLLLAAGAVLEFVEGNSMHIEGVGDVCSLAAFDFQVWGPRLFSIIMFA